MAVVFNCAAGCAFVTMLQAARPVSPATGLPDAVLVRWAARVHLPYFLNRPAGSLGKLDPLAEGIGQSGENDQHLAVDSLVGQSG